MSSLGFGLMRLPRLSDDFSDVDYDAVNEMVDVYIKAGFNYFDSAYGYHNGNADKVVKDCIISRYPREDVIIANKLPLYDFKGDENLEAIFQEQLDKCGVDYFDYYMVHNVTTCFEEVCNSLDCFGFVRDKKSKGLAKKIGFSYHDGPEMLDRVLSENPDMDFVQLQINYLDWDNAIQSRACYEVAREHDIEVIVMETVKGGTLAKVPSEVEKIFKDYNPDNSVASWAVRFCGFLEGVSIVLCGNSSLEHVKDNINTFNNFKPLTDEELEIIDEVKQIIEDSVQIPCSYCDYCLDYCPNGIPISKFFSLHNDAKSSIEVQYLYYIYYNNYAKEGAKASECNYCEECVSHCTQHIDIPCELEKVVELLQLDKN